MKNARPRRRLAAAILAVSVVVAAIAVGTFTGRSGSVAPSHAPGASLGSESAAVTPSAFSATENPTSSSGPGLTPGPAKTPTPTPIPTPSEPPGPPGTVLIVPVADYRSTAVSVGPADVDAVVNGQSSQWKALELVEDQADAILSALGLSRESVGSRLVLAADADTLMTDLSAHRNRLAFMRADQVGPGVAALGWKQMELFGFHHVGSKSAWPLQATLPTTLSGVTPYSPATTWTVFAAGDIGLDRSNYSWAIQLHKGVDWAYDGGTARITRLQCCSNYGDPVPIIQPTGHPGAMRDLISSADLAMANLESPAPDHFSFHASGTLFTGDPALLAGVARAGIDVVSTANNHIGDAGPIGIDQTLKSLTKYGIKYFGAGPNLTAARRPAIFEEGGVKVAILGYDGIAGQVYGATDHRTGDSPLDASHVTDDIAAARAAGAQVVIIYPHWGTEYTRGPNKKQQKFAHLMIDAGADMVIGNHPHWAQAMEIYKGKPIWYALGNFTFDQSWSEPTLEGITLELTFRAGTLVQARMNPHVLIVAVQPNLLDPAGDGQRVLGPIYQASGPLLPW